ncbi:MAG: phosphate ABC transporter permease PstA [Peptococcaceae bacterium]|nr:phosphate ABC transporter permease PstA [Peptococcaceae bacterium]
MRRALKIEETIVKIFLWASVILVFACLFAILFDILKQGLPYVTWEFLTAYPEDMGREGGIFPAIVGTIYVVAVSIIVAAPIGILSATYLTEYSRDNAVVRAIRFATDTLAGVPSIIFGLFGLAFFVIFCGLGWSVLSGGLTLAIMVLPTIVRTTEEAIKSVPRAYREGSMALGATKWQTVYKVVLPSAMPGIVTGIVLSIGRSVGETAAVLFTVGGSLFIPHSIFEPANMLSLHLYKLVSEGISFEMGYATASVLIIMILIINITANYLMRRLTAKRLGSGNA